MNSKLSKKIKKGRKRGEITEKILNVLFAVALSTGDVIEAMLTSPYGSSYPYLEKRISEIESGRRQNEENFRKDKIFRNLLYRLQKDGLIKKDPKGILWRLTTSGKEELHLLRKYRKQYPSLAKYPEVEEGELKVISFDIPERYKHKRNWLRGVLRVFEFQMVHKSVWAGRAQLPREFLDDLRDLDLVQYVEIFAATKAGSLEKLTL